jgi:hypothetical protein
MRSGGRGCWVADELANGGSGLTVKQAAEHYSALLSPELYHLLTVERRWTTRGYASWVTDLLDHDLLG